MPRDVGPTFRKVAALRALCVRLPHLTTPREEMWLRRFDVLVAAPATATSNDVDALAAGWRRWWRDGDIHAIAAMARRLPSGMVDGDRRLASYACEADAVDRPIRDTRA